MTTRTRPRKALRMKCRRWLRFSPEMPPASQPFSPQAPMMNSSLRRRYRLPQGTKAEAAGKLIDEERAREVAQLDGAVEEFTERQERTVWQSVQPRIRSLETLSATMEGEGWLGRMASLLKGYFLFLRFGIASSLLICP